MTRFQYSTPQTASSRSPKVFTEGRVCGYPTCTTRLSRYNSDALCALHLRPYQPPRNIR